MENASKALLIAASVLIAILLIAFGMNIFNSTTGTGDSLKQTMTATEITTFNSKFTSFNGIRTLAEVNALADKVIASNAVSSNKVSFNGKQKADDISSEVAKLTGMRFTVSLAYDSGNILVEKITVTPVS